MEENAWEERALTTLPVVSVVIPTFNRRNVVVRSLKSLFEQGFPVSDFEIIVVDDGSSDGTAQEIRRLVAPCPMRVIEQENSGPGAARNVGVQAAESELILFLDDDMQCDPGLLAAHVKAHRRLEQSVAFGALFLTEDSKANLASECFKREIGAFHLRHSKDPKTEWHMTECVFSNSSIPKQLLMDAGGFDENFRMREDLELGIRLLQRRVHMQYVSEAIAYQYYDKTSSDLLADARKFAVADVMFARKHPGHIIEGHLPVSEEEPGWKKRLRELFARSPALERGILAPWCVLGEVFFPFVPLRSAGVRALQIRRRVHWLREVKEMMGTEIKLPEDKSGSV